MLYLALFNTCNQYGVSSSVHLGACRQHHQGVTNASTEEVQPAEDCQPQAGPLLELYPGSSPAYLNHVLHDICQDRLEVSSLASDPTHSAIPVRVNAMNPAALCTCAIWICCLLLCVGQTSSRYVTCPYPYLQLHDFFSTFCRMPLIGLWIKITWREAKLAGMLARSSYSVMLSNLPARRRQTGNNCWTSTTSRLCQHLVTPTCPLGVCKRQSQRCPPFPVILTDCHKIGNGRPKLFPAVALKHA